MIKSLEYAERRAKIIDKLEDFSVLVLFSGRSKMCSADETYPFVTNRNFYYLTGIDQEDSVLIITKSPISTNTFLFIQPYNELKEKWTGIRLKDFEAKKISGVDNILFYDTWNAKLDVILNEMIQSNGKSSLYLDLENELKIKESYTTKELKFELESQYADKIDVKNIYDTLVHLRMVKSHEEIQLLKEAARITNLGLNSVLSVIGPNMREYQIAALFEYTIRDVANCKTSFNTIAAAGKNATILHYPNPIDTLKDGDLMLLDLGAEYGHYCADVSRTYPINGKYFGTAEKIYDIVLGANKNVADICAPGVTIAQLQKATIEFLTDGCLKAGLIKTREEISNYYFHNVSHHIGLDTHDPSFRDLPLEPGNVISDEPGLYFKELGIGVRIEDDLLVTKNGCIVLTADIAKEKSDIEKLIASRVK